VTGVVKSLLHDPGRGAPLAQLASHEQNRSPGMEESLLDLPREHAPVTFLSMPIRARR
jgi:hypothetical protein